MTAPPEPEAAGLTGRSRCRLLWLLGCAPLLVVLVYQIVASSFLCDDAFVTYRYARSLADGHGLVFNRGERVEGFVHLAWVIELAALFRAGVRPEVAAPALSLAFTVGTLVLVVMLALRSAPWPRCAVIAWVACAFVACSASFAVWSTGGLETRQFTFLIVLGVFLLARTPATPRRLAGASCVFAAAELTRPEAMLLFGCAFVWRLVQDGLRGEASWRRAVTLAAPFTVVVACHFAWRLSYYGEWLPNPYYAKHVAPWYSSGFDYLVAAAIELGAWAWLSLAAVAMVRRAVQRDLSFVLPFVLAVPHALYVARVGGDHFEYRPFDFHGPLFAVPAALGVVLVAEGAVALLVRGPGSQPVRERATCWLAGGFGIVAVGYACVPGAASQQVARDARQSLGGLHARVPLDAQSAPLLRWLPGVPALCAVLNPVRARLHRQLVAVPAQVHQLHGRNLAASYGAYEALPDGTFPRDAVAAANTVGVMPFYVRELTVVDAHGLTDAVIARNPVSADADRRVMAHDRQAPPGYLLARGVNVAVLPVARSEAGALAVADFALRVADGAWMPFQAADRSWAQREFPGDRLVSRHRVDPTRAEANELRLGGTTWTGVRALATFEPGDAGLVWTCAGTASIGPPRRVLMGGVGKGQLTTAVGETSDDEAGSARSSGFVAEAGTALVCFVAGRRALGTEVFLCRGDQVVRAFGPETPMHLHPVLCALDEFAGQTLRLEVHDAGAGWIALDHVLVVRNAASQPASTGESWPAASGRPASGSAFVSIARLRSSGGFATPGTTAITLHNPLPVPVRVAVELVGGPAGSALLCGPWLAADGSAVAHVAAGTTVRMDAYLRVPEGVAVAHRTFVLRLLVHGAHADAPSSGEGMLLELALSWEERN